MCSLTSTGAENETQKCIHMEFLTQLVEWFHKQLDGHMTDSLREEATETNL